MPYTPHIDERLLADRDLVNHVKQKRYRLVLKSLNTHYGLYFLTDQSGTVFESCVDFCAQTAGNVDDAKKILTRLFKVFFTRLPPLVQESLTYLGQEIGYDPQQTNFQRFQHLCSDALCSSTTALASMLRKVRVLIVQTRNRSARTIALVGPLQVTIPASMLMREDQEFILDIRREPELSRYRRAT